MNDSGSGRHLDRVILVALFALFLFIPPALSWWATADLPWYTPYLLWLLVILLGAWVHIWRTSREF